MPPPGGFEPVKYKRNLPIRGPSGLVILGGVTAVCAYGFYRLGKGNLEKRCVESFARVWRRDGAAGQADVERGQSRARPTENVAFCWIRPPACGLSLTYLAWPARPSRRASGTDAMLLLRELQREKVWSRIHLVPLLLAEGDRDAYRRQQAALAREKEIMKDVPGWEVSDISNGTMTECSCSRGTRYRDIVPHDGWMRIWDDGRSVKAYTTTPVTGLAWTRSWLYDPDRRYPLYHASHLDKQSESEGDAPLAFAASSQLDTLRVM